MSERRWLGLAAAGLLLVLGTAPARAGERDYWRSSGGHFENTSGNKWTERAGDSTYHFVETARTEAYVELYDKSRDKTLRLYADRCEIRQPGTNRFERLYDGKWGAAAAVAVIEPLQRVRWTEGDHFQPCDISADGSKFLACRNYSVRVYETKSGKLIRELPLWFAQFTPDGRSVVACSYVDFHVYDVATGKELRGFDPKVHIWNYWLSSSGTRLMMVHEQGGQVWDWSTGTKVCDFPWSLADATFVTATVLTADGRYLLQQVGKKPPLRALDAATGKPVAAYEQLKDVPPLLGMSRDGKRLLCKDGKAAKVYDVLSGREIATIQGGAGWLSDDGRLLLRVTEQQTCGVWDVEHARRVATLQLPEPLDWTINLRTSANGKYAVIAGPTDSEYVFRLPEPSAEQEKPLLRQPDQQP